MLIIFVSEITPRLEYVFSHIFNYLGIAYSITNNEDAFYQSKLCKFSYGNHPLKDELFISSSGFLNQNNLEFIFPTIGQHQGLTTLFQNSDSKSCLPYDIFSAVFYMLSRYEEYLPFTPDEHGRFEAANSFAFQNDYLYTPVVDLWMIQWKDVLLNKFPQLQTKSHTYQFIPSYDIDIAWSFKHKGILRNLGGFIRDGFRLKIRKYFLRLLVLLNIKKDPYDSYDYQFELQQKYNLKPIYFFHPGTYGEFDKNIPTTNKHIIKLIKNLSANAGLGIHPSYKSATYPEILKKEMIQLENASGIKITSARQHFIKIKFPDTYRNYISQGITDDYSMGYASDYGFRAGTSNPFLFFDVLENKTTDLLIHPFVFMEGVFKFYKNIPQKDIIDTIKPVIEQIKQTQGTFICLWHNESLGTSKNWQGWRAVYEALIKEAIK